MRRKIVVVLFCLAVLSGSGSRLCAQEAEHPDLEKAQGIVAKVAEELIAEQGAEAGETEIDLKIIEALRRELGVEHALTLNFMANTGTKLWEQGSYAEARKLYEEVVAVRQRTLGKEHPDTLTAMNNLGTEHPDTLTALANLASTLKAQGDFAGARQHQKQVLEALRRILGADHPDTLTALGNLAGTLYAQGDFASARQREEQVLEARRRILGAEHPDTLGAMHNLAKTLKETGDLDGAQRLLEQVVRIRGRGRGEQSRPATYEEANTLFGLALIHRKAGRLEQAGELFLLALDGLESQAMSFDLSEDATSQYRARFEPTYRVIIAHFLDQGQVEEALHVLERYRARSLLALMRWGQSRPATPPSEIEAELRDVARRYDALTRELEGFEPVAEPRRAELLAERVRLQRRLEVLRGRSMRAGGGGTERLPALRPEEIRHHLDPGTVMLAYSVGAERVDLFVLAKEGPVEAHSLAVSKAELWLQWSRYLPLLLPDDRDDRAGDGAGNRAGDGAGDGAGDPADIQANAAMDARARLGHWLFDKLVAPAGERLAGARRLLILPDGPLHYLPFNALVRPADDDQRGWQYLVEWKAVHVAQSATVYAELQKRRAPAAAGEQPAQTLVALGNPSYPQRDDGPGTGGTQPGGTQPGGTQPSDDHPSDDQQSTGDRGLLAVRSAEERGIFGGLTPLPHTAREVSEIGRLFPAGQARIYLGAEATEERAKGELAGARYLHFAAHGVADPEVPANSFIALTVPEDLPADRDNGILQGWEIVSSQRLDADLVVLSACVTAVGPNRGGEGLMSLSRAFQVAGARTVAASLWPVADDSTTELMIRFYRHLLAGEAKDEALRAAQVELIAGEVDGEIEFVNAAGETVRRDFSAPYHWAAFQLIGDWR